MKIFTVLLFFILSAVSFAQIEIKTDSLLYADDFTDNLDNWIAEIVQKDDSQVFPANGKLIVNVAGGATIWFKHKLSGNFMIEYSRKVVMNGGKNDRLTDLNQFWMANDPQNENLFTRSGIFSEYHPLKLYYVGMGGNNNTSTRLRKYDGMGERFIIKEYSDEAHLLKANREYHIRIICKDGVTKFFVDDEEYFSYADPDPLTEGYFGFRTVASYQEIDDFKIYRLK